MKKLLFIFVLFVNYAFSYAQVYELVWSDEFDYSGLPDPSKWDYDVGAGGWGNNELQFYTEDRTENARVGSGVLTIEAIKESYAGSDYTSARLVTRNLGDWTYGKIEVRAKLAGGRGSWPAIWMLPTDWVYGSWPASGEIDIMEHVGYDPTTIYGTVHTEDYNHSIGTQQGSSLTVADCESAFHVYAINWTEDKIDFYVDDYKYYTFHNQGSWEKWPFDQRFHLLLNIAVGGDWGGAMGVDDAIFPTKMEVDYVRVYKPLGDITISGPEYVFPNEQNVEYSVSNVVGADYNWILPGNVQLVSGQGTNSIIVNWGDTEEEISVDVTIDANTVNYPEDVKLIVIPQNDDYVLEDFETGMNSQLGFVSQPGNYLYFDDASGSLKVEYDIEDASLSPNFTLTFDRPVSMSVNNTLYIKLKTFNYSGSVIARIDLIDLFGRETTYTPVFKLEPIFADGEYHIYGYNFGNNWKTNLPYGGLVDSARINQLRMYVNYGFFGTDNESDSLWIDDIIFSRISAGIKNLAYNKLKVFPNPAADFIYIQNTDDFNTEAVISIFSLTGKCIQKTNYLGENDQVIDIRSFKKGMYILELKSQDGIYISKFLKY